jgi:exodeoxyribonuclease VII large subunit
MSKVGVGDYLVLHKKYREKIIEDGMNLNKKVINVFPYRIGIITAAEGAAIQDILQTFKNDNFIGKVYVKNTIVQGKQCPQSVIDSIK